MSIIILNYVPFVIPFALLLGGVFICREGLPSIERKSVRLSQALLAVYLVSLPISYASISAWEGVGLIRQTSLSQIMLGLIVVMGWVLFTFSRNYMNGQANRAHYYRWLMFTLAAVAFTVISNHLILFWIGWLCISLSLHNLLTFYPDRPRAILAAHKKFIMARIAELTLLVAFILLYQQHQSFYISTILASLSEQVGMGWQNHLAAGLIAFAALIKCAQLPFHGWLIQVVESPTPVSALLHAGVINLGGYMLLLFAPLVSQSTPAIWMLLVVAGLSTLASSLVMTTRISVKVRLAWSTSAQMGLMLLEFALGLYELVLLHLLAHSFYKAYSFLNSGNAVNDHLRLKLSGAASPKDGTAKQTLLSYKDWLFAFAVGTGCVVLVRTVFQLDGAFSTWWLFAIALSILIIQWRSAEHSPPVYYTLATGLFLTVVYATLKSLMTLALPITELAHIAAFSAPDIWAMALFTSLFLISALLHYQIHWPSMRRLSIILFAGLYLDEWVTRAMLKIWPVSLPASAKYRHSTSSPELNLLEKY